MELINTGIAVANYLERYLKDNRLENSGTIKKEKIYLTKPEKEFKKIAKNIMNQEFEITQIEE